MNTQGTAKKGWLWWLALGAATAILLALSLIAWRAIEADRAATHRVLRELEAGAEAFKIDHSEYPPNSGAGQQKVGWTEKLHGYLMGPRTNNNRVWHGGFILISSGDWSSWPPPDQAACPPWPACAEDFLCDDVVNFRK